ncbi:MAG TPA: stage II sporulation protein M, partial [Spirochaetota bacterium]|nr:stage II sporulation protein M [Spirochaetota bacterium]
YALTAPGARCAIGTTGEIVESEHEFVAVNRARWDRLHELLGKRKRSFEELREMGVLYQRATDDLSLCQTRFPGSDAASFLNHLVRRCHTVLFRQENARLKKIIAFFSSRLPELIFDLRYPMIAAFAVFAVSIALSFVMVKRNVVLAEIFLPGQMYDMAVRDLELRQQFSNFDRIPPEMRTAISFYIWFNNSMVSVYCFVLGITFGLGTLFILVRNGFILGALLAVYQMNGHLLDFFSIIMVHGSLELPAIAIAGGAGLSLGLSLIAPGRLRRVDALKESASRALLVLVGVICVLLLAGLIEGLVTPLKLPVGHRLIIMTVNFILLGLYAARGGIMRRDRNSPPSG